MNCIEILNEFQATYTSKSTNSFRALCQQYLSKWHYYERGDNCNKEAWQPDTDEVVQWWEMKGEIEQLLKDIAVWSDNTEIRLPFVVTLAKRAQTILNKIKEVNP